LEDEGHSLKNDRGSYQVPLRETTDNIETKSIPKIVSDDSTNNEDND